MKTAEVNITETTTTRELRRILFTLDSAEANALRHELFNIDEQDCPAKAEHLDQAREIVRKG